MKLRRMQKSGIWSPAVPQVAADLAAGHVQCFGNAEAGLLRQHTFWDLSPSCQRMQAVAPCEGKHQVPTQWLETLLSFAGCAR